MKEIITILLLVLLSSCASVQTLGDNNWKLTQSNNFSLYSQLPENKTTELLESLEAFHNMFSMLYLQKDLQILPTHIYVLSGNEAKLFDISSNVGGYFSNRMTENVIYLRESRDIEDMLSVILHEYIHYAHAQVDLSLPRWLEEGTAEYFGGIQVGEGEFTFGMAQKGRLRSLSYSRWLRWRNVIEPEDIYSWSSESISLHYAQSWLLTFYLNNRSLSTGQSFKKQLQTYQMLLKTDIDKIAAFEQAFDLKINRLDSILTKYLKRGSFVPFKLHKENLLKNTSISTYPLSKAQANLQLAQFANTRGLLEPALTFSENAMDKDNQIDALLARVNSYYLHQKYDDAQTTLNKLSTLNDLPAQYYIMQAKINMVTLDKSFPTQDRELLKETKKLLVKAWKLERDNSEIFSLNGHLYFYHDIDTQEAMGMYSEAINLNKSYNYFDINLLKVIGYEDPKDAHDQAVAYLESINSEYDEYLINDLKSLKALFSNINTYQSKPGLKAFAVNGDGGYGYSYGYDSIEQANKVALKYCEDLNQDSSCKIIHTNDTDEHAFTKWYLNTLYNE